MKPSLNFNQSGIRVLLKLHIKSLDRGYTWEAVELGDEEDGVFGNSDEDLAIAPDGSVHLVVCDVDQNGGKGIAVASLRVGEERWKWTAISRNRGNDRPWIEASPDGVLHVIWNDGSGVHYTRSTDSGELAATWHSGYGTDLGVHVAYIRLNPDSGTLEQKDVRELPAETLGPWGPDRKPSAAVLGEYKPVTFLKDGGLAVVTPIFQGFEKRWGFRYHRIEEKHPYR